MEIKPITGINASVRAPGSKSYTQRALIVAALAQGDSTLHNALLSEDTTYVTNALKAMGAEIATTGTDMIIKGTGGHLKGSNQAIYLGNNGTAMRLLTGVAALGTSSITLTGSSRLCERPIKPLITALQTIGVDAEGCGANGSPPVVVHARRPRGGSVTLTDIESSQYVSSLLLCAPFAENDTVIELVGEIPSLPYVAMTAAVMDAFGVMVGHDRLEHYVVKSGQRYHARHYEIEGDYSSASYFFLAAAVTRGKIRVQRLNPETLQGDRGFLPLLEQLGCTLTTGRDWVEVQGRELAAGDYTFNLGAMPDMVPTLAVLAAVRPGRTVISHVPHLRAKESNRLEALVTELKKVGVRAEETVDGLLIEGGSAQGSLIETYHDHRIAMSFAVLGLAVPGIRIQDPGCVAKSFPAFWDELERLYNI
jgi:3-phosphoshikimate 1-carboxyvinyltransferase